MPNELCLYGEIGVDITSVDVKTLLAQMDQTEDLVVRIDSPGGSVFQGFSIHESLSQYPGQKQAVVESAAMSIASYILTAFEDVAIARNGYVMIHNPNMVMNGDDEAFSKAASDLTKYKSTMVSDYAQRTGKSESEILEMMRAETYLNADEAIEMGFATSKTEPIPSRVVAAKTKHMPAAVRKSLADAKAARGDSPAEERPVADQPKRVAATVREVKAIHPHAKPEFIVRCVEKEMTAEEVQHEAMEELRSENEELQAKLKAMEDEKEEARAKAEEEAKAKAEEEEKAKAEEKEEETAKAKARGHYPIAATIRSGSVSAREKWSEVIDEYQKRGMSRVNAVQRANQSYPGLRQQIVDEANAVQ